MTHGAITIEQVEQMVGTLWLQSQMTNQSIVRNALLRPRHCGGYEYKRITFPPPGGRGLALIHIYNYGESSRGDPVSSGPYHRSVSATVHQSVPKLTPLS